MAHTDLNDAQTPLLGSVVTKTPFEVELVTIKSKKSFKELVDLIESIAQGLFRFSPRAGLGAPVRFCVSQRDGEAAQIDIDLPSSFFGQIPELAASPVPKELDERMIGILTKIAS